MMEQYLEIKAAHPDYLLFYRMGDFYELFFEDAEVASRALGIVLTKRGKHLGERHPDVRGPRPRADDYLHQLIAHGLRVAVCEQMEDPAEAKKRGGKAWCCATSSASSPPARSPKIRCSMRAATTTCWPLPGRALDRREPVSRSPGPTFRPASSALTECDRAGLAAEIARLEPGEMLVSDALFADPELAPFLRSLPAVTPLARDVFDGASAERRLAAYFAVATTDAFGTFSRLELTAAAACSPMWSARRRASARRCRRPSAKPQARRWRSMPRRAPISSSPRRSPANGAAPCSSPSTAP